MAGPLHPTLSYFVLKECDENWRLDNPSLPHYDLTFVLEGAADYVVNGKDCLVKKGDVLFFEPGSSRRATAGYMLCASFDFSLEPGEALRLPAVSSWGGDDSFGERREGELLRYFHEINYEWLQRSSGYELKCQGLFTLILHRLLYGQSRPAGNAHVERIKRHIVEHYQEKLTVRGLAEVAGINSVYCGALFKRQEGCTVADYINRVRVNQAASLLVTGEYNVGEAGEKCGFGDVYYFSATFKRLMGVSPSAYKNGRSASNPE